MGIALDAVENKLYWTTSNGEIGRSTLGDGDFQPNLVTGLGTPGAFVLNVETPVAVETPEILTTDAVVSVSPSPVISPAVGERLTLSLKITAGEAVAGYQFTVQFDPTALRYVESGNGDYLPTGAFFVQPVVNRDRVEIAATALAGVSKGDGTLATLTFEVLSVKASTLTLSEPLFSDAQGNTFLPRVEGAEITQPPKLKGDVNADGVVNIQDLVLVASSFGRRDRMLQILTPMVSSISPISSWLRGISARVSVRHLWIPALWGCSRHQTCTNGCRRHIGLTAAMLTINAGYGCLISS